MPVQRIWDDIGYTERPVEQMQCLGSGLGVISSVLAMASRLEQRFRASWQAIAMPVQRIWREIGDSERLVEQMRCLCSGFGVILSKCDACAADLG